MSSSSQVNPQRLRTELYADPAGVFVHDAVLSACRKYAAKTVFIDTSYPAARRISYGEYGETVERLARGLVPPVWLKVPPSFRLTVAAMRLPPFRL